MIGVYIPVSQAMRNADFKMKPWIGSMKLVSRDN